MTNSLHKITNLLSSSLLINDLGIILQAYGGSDSMCVLSHDSYTRSVSVKEHLSKKRVSVCHMVNGIISLPATGA